MGIKVNLKNVRIFYVSVYQKAADRTNPAGELVKGKYEITAVLDKNDPQLSKLDSVALEVLTEGMKSAKAAEKWMDKNYGFGNHAEKCAVRDLSERDKPIGDLHEGIYFKATSQKRPVIMTSEGERQSGEKGLTIDGDEIEGKEVYSGCFANISVEFYWYDKFKILNANLLGVRFREDGEAFGGASEVATDDDLDDDDDKPSKPKRRPSRDEDDEEEERPRKKRRNYEDDEE